MELKSHLGAPSSNMTILLTQVQTIPDRGYSGQGLLIYFDENIWICFGIEVKVEEKKINANFYMKYRNTFNAQNSHIVILKNLMV